MTGKKKNKNNKDSQKHAENHTASHTVSHTTNSDEGNNDRNPDSKPEATMSNSDDSSSQNSPSPKHDLNANDMKEDDVKDADLKEHEIKEEAIPTLSEPSDEHTHQNDGKPDSSEPSVTPSSEVTDSEALSAPPTAPPTTPPATSDTTKNAPSRWLSVLSLCICILIIISLSIGAYFTWQFWQSQNTRIQQLEAQVGSQSSTLNDREQQQSSVLKQQEQQFTALRSSIANNQTVVQQRLDTHAERLQALTGTDRTRWVLEEARYLLRLANQRQLTGGGISGIIGLLESSDTLLRELDVPDLFPIRDAINKDILALKIAPKVDREGVYLQLSAVIDQVEQLPTMPLQHLLQRQQKQSTSDTASTESSETSTDPANATANNDQENSPSFWQSLKHNVSSSLSKSISALDQYIRIKSDHEQPLQPLMTDAQQYMMAQNLRLMLDQAQIALLREEQVIYRDSLDKTARWIDSHYQHFAERKALIDHINTLKDLSIVSVLPDISASLVRLTNHIKYQDNLLSAEAKAEPKPKTATLIPPASNNSDDNIPEKNTAPKKITVPKNKEPSL